ncbi:hypothetical protein GCM10020000_62030 [Streptomyces olivoverticillatus]
MGGPKQPIDARVSAPASYDVADFPVPHGREEEWRFTPLERLRGLHDGTAVATGAGVKVEVEAPEGVTVETVGRDDARLGKAGKPVDRVAAQAYSSFEKASVVSIPKETQLTEPVRISVHGEGGVAFGHQVVEVGAFSEAVVVLDHTGDATLAANVEYLLGDGAKLTVVSVQDWDASAVHAAQHTALVGRDASFKSVIVTFGGDLVRLHPPGRLRRPPAARPSSTVCTSPTAASTRSTASSSTTTPRTAAATSPTRARCRARTRTPSGSATCSSAPRPRAPTPTSSTATWCSPTAPGSTRSPTWRSRPVRSSAPDTPRRPAASRTSSCST